MISKRELALEPGYWTTPVQSLLQRYNVYQSCMGSHSGGRLSDPGPASTVLRSAEPDELSEGAAPVTTGAASEFQTASSHTKSPDGHKHNTNGQISQYHWTHAVHNTFAPKQTKKEC